VTKFYWWKPCTACNDGRQCWMLTFIDCIMVFGPVIWCRVFAVIFAIFTKVCRFLPFLPWFSTVPIYNPKIGIFLFDTSSIPETRSIESIATWFWYWYHSCSWSCVDVSTLWRVAHSAWWPVLAQRTVHAGINISQGSVATPLRFGGTCWNDRFVTDFPPGPPGVQWEIIKLGHYLVKYGHYWLAAWMQWTLADTRTPTRSRRRHGDAHFVSIR